MRTARQHAADLRNLAIANVVLGDRNLDGNGHWHGGSYIGSDGYCHVRVSADNGRTRYKPEHRLVMERALNRRLQTSEHVHHKNGNKLDNRVENLEVLSAADHARRHRDSTTAAARTPAARANRRRIHGARLRELAFSRRKLAACDVLVIRRSTTNGISQATLCRLYGVSDTLVSDIVLRRTWKDI